VSNFNDGYISASHCLLFDRNCTVQKGVALISGGWSRIICVVPAVIVMVKKERRKTFDYQMICAVCTLENDTAGDFHLPRTILSLMKSVVFYCLGKYGCQMFKLKGKLRFFKTLTYR